MKSKWTEYNKPYNADNSSMGFQYEKFNRPGVLIEVRNKDNELKKYLTGSINRNGGCCDCCPEDFVMDENYIITRYKILINENELE